MNRSSNSPGFSFFGGARLRYEQMQQEVVVVPPAHAEETPPVLADSDSDAAAVVTDEAPAEVSPSDELPSVVTPPELREREEEEAPPADVAPEAEAEEITPVAEETTPVAEETAPTTEPILTDAELEALTAPKGKVSADGAQ